MAYGPQQRSMIDLAKKLSANSPMRVRKALLEAMAVESNFRNLGYGDRDSEGVLQQRPSTGWGPASESAGTDIRQFLSRANQTNRGFQGSAGQLAQAVQRSAFPDRYDEHKQEVNRLLGARAFGNSPSIPSSRVFGQDSSTSGLASQRKAFADFFLSRASSRITGDEAPSLLSLANSLQTQTLDPTPAVMPGPNPVGQNKSGRYGSDAPAAVAAGKYAQGLGLRVSENPYFDKVDPVHVAGSDHYRTLGKYQGRPYGAALDVSGDPAKLKRYFRWLEANRKKLGLDDEFYTPMGYSYDEGRRVGGFTIPNHDDHVHVSFGR